MPPRVSRNSASRPCTLRFAKRRGKLPSLIGAALKLKPKTLERLQNLDHGLWQGMLIEEVKRKQPKVYKQWQEQPENVCPPEGEMLAAAAEARKLC